MAAALVAPVGGLVKPPRGCARSVIIHIVSRAAMARTITFTSFMIGGLEATPLGLFMIAATVTLLLRLLLC